MPIRVSCACGKNLLAKDELSGRRVQCPGCGKVVSVPALGEPEAIPVARPLAPVPVGRPLPDPVVRKASAAGPRFAGRLYWLLLLALVPLAIHIIFVGKDDTEQRFERSVERLSEKSSRRLGRSAEFDDEVEVAAIVNRLPGKRIEGAALPANTNLHWLMGLGSAAFFFLLLFVLFPQRQIDVLWPLGIGVATGTVGIVLLLFFQLLAAVAQGQVVVSRDAVFTILYWSAWLVGFSYRAALDPDTGFVPSLLGFTFGVGLCEEIIKALPLLIKVSRGGRMSAQAACRWGFASGVGFGVAEAILYAGDHYNGLATPGIYWVRFISCVALHGIWTASAGLFIWRYRKLLRGDFPWYEYVPRSLLMISVPIVLHGLYDTLLKKDLDVAALAVGIASFGWLAWQIEKVKAKTARAS